MWMIWQAAAVIRDGRSMAEGKKELWRWQMHRGGNILKRGELEEENEGDEMAILGKMMVVLGGDLDWMGARARG
ncbi:unnamed protein product [Calypogeia fissa]